MPSRAKSSSKSSAKSPREATRNKVRAYRARLRKQGLRPIQIWVPDVNSPEFIAEAKRQARLIAESPYEQEDQAFINAIAVELD
jgi:hypothetical protein